MKLVFWFFLLVLIAATSASSSGVGKRSKAATFKTQKLQIPSVRPANPALKKLCYSTDYPALCLSSLSPFIYAGRNDPSSILATAIKAVSHHAAAAMAAMSRMAAAKSTDAETAAALKQCVDSYGDAIQNLRSAGEAISRRDDGTANSMLSAVVTDSGDCEDSFQGKSPVFEYNEKMRKMASNCLAIVSVIKW